MRFLIDHHARLESMYFRMMDKKQRMASIQDRIREKQRDRQHMIWNMLQYMKDVYDTAVQYERDDQPEQELAQEFNSLHRFAQGFINDPDLRSIIRLSDDLQPANNTTASALLRDFMPSNPVLGSAVVPEASPNEEEPHEDKTEAAVAEPLTIQAQTAPDKKHDATPS